MFLRVCDFLVLYRTGYTKVTGPTDADISKFNCTLCVLVPEPCTPLRCVNGAKCEEDSQSAFYCRCAKGFYGLYCESEGNVGYSEYSEPCLLPLLCMHGNVAF